MKIKLQKNVRTGIMIFCYIIICFLLYLIYDEIFRPEYQEETTVHYSYNNKSNIDYKVFLKPNILYDTGYLEENHIYFTQYIDYIHAAFKYEFTGSGSSNIEANYRISALVEGYTGSDKIQTLWQKEFPLVPETVINTQDKSLSIVKDVQIQLDTYNEFSKMVAETSKVNTQSKVSVIMYVDVKAKTEKGDIIQEHFKPSLVIPLNTYYFVISEDIPAEKSGTVESTQKIKLPADLNKILLYSGLILLSVAGLVLLILFTDNSPDKSRMEKALVKIFKDFGSRLVALESEILKDYGDYIRVHSIDDLVKISDELEKPIMYSYADNSNNVRHFFVLDGPVMYVYDLNNSIPSFFDESLAETK